MHLWKRRVATVWHTPLCAIKIYTFHFTVILLSSYFHVIVLWSLLIFLLERLTPFKNLLQTLVQIHIQIPCSFCHSTFASMASPASSYEFDGGSQGDANNLASPGISLIGEMIPLILILLLMLVVSMFSWIIKMCISKCIAPLNIGDKGKIKLDDEATNEPEAKRAKVVVALDSDKERTISDSLAVQAYNVEGNVIQIGGHLEVENNETSPQIKKKGRRKKVFPYHSSWL